MIANKRTNIALIALGLVSAVTVGYFVWNYLAPPIGALPPAAAPAAGLDTGVLSESKFQELQPYAELPIVPTNVGRADPFAPFPVRNANANGNANSGANANLNANTP